MCNKFGFNDPLHKLQQAFGDIDLPFVWPEAAPNLAALEEIKPTDSAPLVRPFQSGAQLEQVRWGFPPPKPKAGPIINFRSEGRTFASGRALAPATHFFEFTAPADPKQKRKDQWRFNLADGELFCLAALWRAGSGGAPDSFTLLTRDAGADVAPYHDREIIILPRGLWAWWLTAPQAKGDDLPALPAGSLAVAPVKIP